MCSFSQFYCQLAEKSCIREDYWCVCVCACWRDQKWRRMTPFRFCVPHPQMFTFWQKGNCLNQAVCIWLPLILFLLLINFITREYEVIFSVKGYKIITHVLIFFLIGSGKHNHSTSNQVDQTIYFWTSTTVTDDFYNSQTNFMLLTAVIFFTRTMNFSSVIGCMSCW